MALGPWITEADRDAVDRVLMSGDLMSGDIVAQLEGELAAYFGKRHCVCVSSGTAALECAFVATGEGSEIDANGFVAILSAARAAGEDPVFHSSGTQTDLLGIEDEPGTRVHDCCHRFDREAAHAEVSCFSFAPNKFIAACGGCLVTDDSVVASIARQYRNHGRDGGPEVFREGRNLRMPELSGALALSQFRRIDEILARRKQVAAWYDEVTGQRLAETRASWFLYPWCRPDTPAPKGQRTMRDFRLFGSTLDIDDCTWLMPIWPTMTRAEVEEACRR